MSKGRKKDIENWNYFRWQIVKQKKKKYTLFCIQCTFGTEFSNMLPMFFVVSPQVFSEVFSPFVIDY